MALGGDDIGAMLAGEGDLRTPGDQSIDLDAAGPRDLQRASTQRCAVGPVKRSKGAPVVAAVTGSSTGALAERGDCA
ncbi:hypothetical protein [Streptomyces sp. NRRL S-1448]|uniref:hypothetical protein n=1 Tax=Streptomyces sp. NRRL S-1448 TaxID=1463883 RepID=UPI0004C15212|nr:hypothetical protein [Streptomyces sp. NRRL S-1448]